MKNNFQFLIFNFQSNINISSRGYTWPELIIATGIIALLFGFLTVNLFSAQHKAGVNTAVTTLIADIKNQQAKAMVGQTEGRTTADAYSVHFTPTSYVLFHGATFNQSDITNLTLTLDTSLQFTNITFPSSNIIFAQGSGEVTGFTNGQNTVTVSTTQGIEKRTITINQYGVITNVQ